MTDAQKSIVRIIDHDIGTANIEFKMRFVVRYTLHYGKERVPCGYCNEEGVVIEAPLLELWEVKNGKNKVLSLDGNSANIVRRILRTAYRSDIGVCDEFDCKLKHDSATGFLNRCLLKVPPRLE